MANKTKKLQDEKSLLFAPQKRIPYSDDATAGVLAHIPIRARRSALDFVRKPITLAQFQQQISRVTPLMSEIPSSSYPDCDITIGLYVYRVEGLTPGYCI